MVMQSEQKALVELECTWELLHHLPDALQELREHGRRLLLVDGAKEPAPVCKLVAERQPLLLYKGLWWKKKFLTLSRPNSKALFRTTFTTFIFNIILDIRKHIIE